MILSSMTPSDYITFPSDISTKPSNSEARRLSVKENISGGGLFSGQYDPFFTESSLIAVSDKCN